MKKEKHIKWGSKEFWKRIDRTGNEFSMHQMKWLLGGVANTINNNGEILKNEHTNLISNAFTKLDIFNRGGAWKKNKQKASELIKKIRVVKVKNRKGGAPMSKQICQDYALVDDDLLHILSLNTWKAKDGSNFNQIIEQIVKHQPTCVCLQEVVSKYKSEGACQSEHRVMEHFDISITLPSVKPVALFLTRSLLFYNTQTYLFLLTYINMFLTSFTTLYLHYYTNI